MPQAARSAILAPGANYSADGPLLMYARFAVRRRDGQTRSVRWDLPRTSDASQLRSQAIAQVETAFDELTAASGTAPLLIGKSMGSLTAPLAADRGLAAVWFTPLLTDAATVAAMRRATAPCLLVGGTADQLWDGPVARSITPDVVEIDGADHGMFVPGPMAASAAILGQIMTAVEDFLDHHVWPAGVSAET